MVAFLACAVFGGVLLLAQLLLGGIDADAAGDDGSGAGDALSIAGLRPLAAGVAFFGLAGAGVRASGRSVTVALLVGVAAALVAAAATAALLRSLRRLDSDGTVRLDRAVGAEATVYVPVSARSAGKVHLALQGRVVECTATAADDASYPTGARVLVVDVTPDGGVLVAADPAAPVGRGSLPPRWSPPS